MIMDFVTDNTLSLDQAKEPLFLKEIACAIQKINSITEEEFTHMDTLGSIKKNFKSLNTQESLAPVLAQAKRQFKLLKRDILTQNKPLVFCHGDLHSRNIFFINQEIVLIDWSDGGMGYPFFDLASISVFCCLTDENDKLLLTYYLQKKPSQNKISYFQSMKKIVRIYDALRVLAYFKDQNIPLVNTVSTNNFTQLQKIWSEDASVTNNSEFLYELAYSQLQEFLKKS